MNRKVDLDRRPETGDRAGPGGEVRWTAVDPKRLYDDLGGYSRDRPQAENKTLGKCVNVESSRSASERPISASVAIPPRPSPS
jgi:hypothetical protein